MSDAAEFVDLVFGDFSESSPFKHATIPDDYVGGQPHLLFDGETMAGDRVYPCLGSYIPAAGDRVLVAMTGKTGGGVVLGKIN